MTDGCRVPHRWLPDGRSLYDVVGRGFTLLTFDSDIDATALEDHARRRKVPLTRLDLHADEPVPGGRHRLLLVRPDQHIAWRGEHPPRDPGNLIDQVRGADATSRHAHHAASRTA